MHLEETLRSRGGVTRTATLVGHGYSEYSVRRSLASGRLIRPRRGWVAVPDADPELLYACRHGVLLTCITAAQRHGLWVLEHPQHHVAARTPNGRPAALDAVIHWHRPLVPRHPDRLVDPLENILDCVARCQPHEVSVAIWDSALQQGRTDVQSLSQLPFVQRGRRVLDECTPFSDSGLESMLRTRLRWLPLPKRTQAWIFGHRVDILIGARLVVQIDGGHHVGAQRTRDIQHDARLLQRGYHVIRVSYAQVVYHWEEVEDMILSAVARGRHLAQ